MSDKPTTASFEPQVIETVWEEESSSSLLATSQTSQSTSLTPTALEKSQPARLPQLTEGLTAPGLNTVDLSPEVEVTEEIVLPEVDPLQLLLEEGLGAKPLEPLETEVVTYETEVVTYETEVTTNETDNLELGITEEDLMEDGELQRASLDDRNSEKQVGSISEGLAATGAGVAMLGSATTAAIQNGTSAVAGTVSDVSSAAVDGVVGASTAVVGAGVTTVGSTVTKVTSQGGSIIRRVLEVFTIFNTPVAAFVAAAIYLSIGLYIASTLGYKDWSTATVMWMLGWASPVVILLTIFALLVSVFQGGVSWLRKRKVEGASRKAEKAAAKEEKARAKQQAKLNKAEQEARRSAMEARLAELAKEEQALKHDLGNNGSLLARINPFA